MATEYPGNITPAPRFKQGGGAINNELLYSTAGFTQKGVTLKAGQGVLLLGTILAQDTVTKRYVKYVSGGSNGAGTPRGFLRQSVDTGTDSAGIEFVGNIVIQGILKLNVVNSANSGQVANAVTALAGARTDTVLNTFTF